MDKRIAIRVDGTNRMGTGHVMRCLTLAHELKRQGAQPLFCSKIMDPFLRAEAAQQGFGFEPLGDAGDIKEDAHLLGLAIEKNKCKVVILDGYDFVGEYIKAIREKAEFIINVDDTAHSTYVSDMILNQNIGAFPAMYDGKIPPYTQLFLGTDYVLLRDEFKQYRDKPRSFDVVRNVLIAFGGADLHNQVLKTLKALDHINGEFAVTVVLGSSNPHKKEVEAFVAQNKRHVIIYQYVDFMAKLMSEADIVISSGGATTWEVCYLGVPSVQTMLAENQISVLKELDQRGVVKGLGWYEDVSEHDISNAVRTLIDHKELRESMSRKGRTLVDGSGAQRVAATILKNRVFG